MKILIDNGHGIETPGKRSPEWPNESRRLFEWEFNRDIARRVHETLTQKDIDCELIVKEINDVSLQERCNRVNTISNQVGKTNCMLVSIHANAGGGTGWEVFYTRDAMTSQKIASVFSEEVTSRHDTDFPFRNRGLKYDPLFILKHPNCPAILTENLFMDTWDDFLFLCSEKGRAIIADIHVQAILKYLKTILIPEE